MLLIIISRRTWKNVDATEHFLLWNIYKILINDKWPEELEKNSEAIKYESVPIKVNQTSGKWPEEFRKKFRIKN
jgi:hypothetical protein